MDLYAVVVVVVVVVGWTLVQFPPKIAYNLDRGRLCSSMVAHHPTTTMSKVARRSQGRKASIVAVSVVGRATLPLRPLSEPL